MKIFIVLLLIVNFIYAQDYKTILSCGNTKSEFVELSTGKIDGYTKDSLVADIVVKNKTNKFYIKVGSSISELIEIDKNRYAIQFIEKVASGHSVLYTILGNKLTIQKSYSMLGTPVMVNMILECR